MIVGISCCARWMAERIDPRPGMAVLSIADQVDTAIALHAGWFDALTIRFPDTGFDGEAGLAAVGGWGRWRGLGFFSDVQAEVIRHWLAKLHRSPERVSVLIHCPQGEGRSTAVARFVALEYRLPFDLEAPNFNRTVFEILKSPDRWAGKRALAQRLPLVRRLASLFA